MRHYLLYRDGSYYILSGQPKTVLEAANAMISQPVTSVLCSDYYIALRHLMLAAYYHHITAIDKRATGDCKLTTTSKKQYSKPSSIPTIIN